MREIGRDHLLAHQHAEHVYQAKKKVSALGAKFRHQSEWEKDSGYGAGGHGISMILQLEVEGP